MLGKELSRLEHLGSSGTSSKFYSPNVGKECSRKFGHLLTIAVMFADGPLVLLVRHDVRVRKGRRALHGILVHP